MTESFPPKPDLEDPDLPLAVLFRAWPMAGRVFLARRMLCFGCPIAPFHTVIDACGEYGLDEAEFRAELAAAVAEAPGPRPRSEAPDDEAPSP